MHDPLGAAIREATAREKTSSIELEQLRKQGFFIYGWIVRLDISRDVVVKEAAIQAIIRQREKAPPVIEKCLRDKRLSRSTRDQLGRCLVELGDAASLQIAAKHYSMMLVDPTYELTWNPSNPTSLVLTNYRRSFVQRSKTKDTIRECSVQMREAAPVLLAIGKEAIPDLLPLLSSKDLTLRVNVAFLLRTLLEMEKGRSLPYNPWDLEDDGVRMKAWAKRLGKTTGPSQPDTNTDPKDDAK